MQLGIKLNIGFEQRERFRRLYGNRDTLAYLKGLGVSSVETPVRAKTVEEDLADHLRRCCEAGLGLSLHPYTEGSEFNPARFSLKADNPCRTLHERFFLLAAEGAELVKGKTVVNVHPAAGSLHVPRRGLVDRSARFFEWANTWCREKAPSVHPVAELQIHPNPGETVQRVGDRFDELFEVVERSGCGACWDFGHGFLNAQLFGMAPEPPPELLPRITHVHLHDVNHEDHQPLIYGRVPWERYLENLVAAGFDGTVILEVPPENFTAAGGLESLEHSVRAVLEFMKG